MTKTTPKKVPATTTAAKDCSTYRGNGFWGNTGGERTSNGKRSIEECRTLCEQSASCVAFNVATWVSSNPKHGNCYTYTALTGFMVDGNANSAYTCNGETASTATTVK